MAGHERGPDQHRLSDLRARKAWNERLRARRWRGLSYLLGVRARTGRSVVRISVARPRTQGQERDQLLVAAPRPLLIASERAAGIPDRCLAAAMKSRLG